jgi:hypothetical protein
METQVNLSHWVGSDVAGAADPPRRALAAPRAGPGRAGADALMMRRARRLLATAPQ